MAVKIVTRKNLDKEDEKGTHSLTHALNHSLAHSLTHYSLITHDFFALKGLRQEVEILKAMKHSNIVQCYDFFEEPDKFYVVLEYLEGIFSYFFSR